VKHDGTAGAAAAPATNSSSSSNSTAPLALDPFFIPMTQRWKHQVVVSSRPLPADPVRVVMSAVAGDISVLGGSQLLAAPPWLPTYPSFEVDNSFEGTLFYADCFSSYCSTLNQPIDQSISQMFNTRFLSRSRCVPDVCLPILVDLGRIVQRQRYLPAVPPSILCYGHVHGFPYGWQQVEGDPLLEAHVATDAVERVVTVALRDT
jgi:hypothetical protein